MNLNTKFIKFNIIFVMRTNIAVAKLRCPSLTNATVSPQLSLLSKDETHGGIRNGVFLNERCEPNTFRILQDVINRRLTTCHAASRLAISDRHCPRTLEFLNDQIHGISGCKLQPKKCRASPANGINAITSFIFLRDHVGEITSINLKN